MLPRKKIYVKCNTNENSYQAKTWWLFLQLQMQRIDANLTKKELDMYILTYQARQIKKNGDDYMPKIFIDAGHGGKDPGAVNGDIYEKDIALQIALKLNNALKNNGFQTAMSRSTDVFIPLTERAQKANNFNADIFISLHLNSSTNSNAEGIEFLVYENKGVNNKLASNIQNELIKIKGIVNRGIKERKDLAVLNSTRMPAILIEVGFISNNRELTLLRNDIYQNQIVQAINNGICNFFGAVVKSMVKVQNVQDALKILHEKGVINSIDYWVKAADIVKYLDTLIINMANKLD